MHTRRKTALKILVAVIFMPALLIALLPTILSSPPARALILGMTSTALDASVSVRTWSISWLKGVSVEELNFQDQLGTRVRIESIVMTNGLFKFFAPVKDFGRVIVRNPDIIVAMPPTNEARSDTDLTGKASPTHPAPHSQEPPGASPPQADPNQPRRHVNFDMVGRLTVTGGHLRLVAPDAGTPFELDGLNMEVDIASLNRPIGVTVAGLGRLRTGSGNTNVVEDENAQFAAVASLDLPGDRITVSSLNFDSRPVSLSCTGTVSGVSSSRTLDAAGTIRCDLARISGLVTALDPAVTLDIEGNEERAFSVHLALGESGWVNMLRTARAGARLHVGRIRQSGMDARDFDVVLEVGGAQARTTLETRINDGELLLCLLIDATGTAPFLRMPDNSQLMKDVRLTDAMASELLALIHPVFRGCAVVGGRMDLTMKHLEAPMDARFLSDMTMDGAIALKGLELGPGGTLRDLMSAAQLDVRNATVPDQEITFRARDRRITPSPLTITANGYTMTLRGSVGFDKTLSYVAEIPINRKMVGDKAYKHVKDASVEIHIGGTVTKPVISTESMIAALRKLAQAASEDAIDKKGGKLIDDLIKGEDKEKTRDMLKDLLKQVK